MIGRTVSFRGWVAAALAGAMLAACASVTGVKPPPPSAEEPTGVFRPSGELNLGDYAKSGQDGVLKTFSSSVVKRYAAGAPMAGVVKDLVENQFACSSAKVAGGDPPDQVCRRKIEAGGCDHTWQVHLFADPANKANLARVRGLYDRACGGDDLLGG